MVGMGEAFGIAFVVIALVAALHGCGGGGGSSSSPQPPAPVPVPSPRTEPLQYGYFGIDGEQITETASHVTFVMAPDWGDWTTKDYDVFRSSTMITQLQQAKALGVKEAWIMVGWLVFEQSKGCISGTCLRPRIDGMDRLQAFKNQLTALGLLDMVKVLYPVDEPETYGLDDKTLLDTLMLIRLTWSDVKLGVIYGGDNHGYPGLAGYDLVGKDHYGAGAGVLNELPPITAKQRHVLVPGGADGLNKNGPDDPQPFYDYAVSHNEVAAIVPFVWFDRTGTNGSILHGIRSNGMATKYSNIGVKIKNGS